MALGSVGVWVRLMVAELQVRHRDPLIGVERQIYFFTFYFFIFFFLFLIEI
ncbi:hypothetical protein CsatB_000872 [Cannabis sativa]